jgi:hypothetical protein
MDLRASRGQFAPQRLDLDCQFVPVTFALLADYVTKHFEEQSTFAELRENAGVGPSVDNRLPTGLHGGDRARLARRRLRLGAHALPVLERIRLVRVARLEQFWVRVLEQVD